MDRELSGEYLKKRKWSVGFTAGITILVFALLFFGVRLLIKPVIHLSDLRTAVVDRGDLEATISASGILLPEFEEIIASPVTSRILELQHNVGERVNKGEIIMLLDKTGEQLQLEKMKEELSSKQNRLKKLQLTIQKALIDLHTNYEIQRLRLESLETSFENEKYIKGLGGSTQEMVKQAELNAKISRMELDHLSQSIDNQKATMQTDIKDLEFEINIHKRNMEEVNRILDESDVKATGNGVITWVNDKIGTTVALGSELVKLADLSSFKAEGSVSEIYLNKLAIGGKVKLSVNDSILSGKISAINPTVQNDAVKFSVQLDNKHHSSLRSNQKVDLFIVTSFHKNVIRLPREGFNGGGASTYVFVLRGDKAIRTRVQFGESNSGFLEIVKGLVPGDVVIVSDMEDNMHLKEIKVKN